MSASVREAAIRATIKYFESPVGQEGIDRGTPESVAAELVDVVLDSLREAAGSGGAEAADAARRDAAEHIRDVGSLSTETKTAADAYAHAADLVESLIGLPSPVSPASQVRR